MQSLNLLILPLLCSSLVFSTSKQSNHHNLFIATSLIDTTPLKHTIEAGNKGDKVIFENVDIEASFPGDLSGWQQFLMGNLNPNTPILKGAPAGSYTVVIQFIVSKDGSLSAIKALTRHGFGMEAEVIRILRKSPKWSPAQQNGNFVNAYRKQPVTFVVQAEKRKGRM